MVKGLSFKKEPRVTGLAGVGAGEPSTQIKFNKQQVGKIASPNRWTNDSNWRVKLCVKRENENNFDWVTFKAKFKDEQSARAWVMSHWETLTNGRVLYALD